MSVIKVFWPQDIQELQKINEELQKKIEEQEEINAALRMAIAEKLAKLKEIRKRKEAPSVQEELGKQRNNEKVVECRVIDNSLSSSVFSMFGEDRTKELLSKLERGVNNKSSIDTSKGFGNSN